MRAKVVTDGNPVVKDSTSQSPLDEQANSAKSQNAGELVDAIRLDEAFALSPNLKPETVVAYVNAMPITVRDVISNANSPTASAGWTPTFGKVQPPNVEHALRHHLPAYLYQELLLQHFLEFTPDERQTVVRESLQAPFLEVLRRIKAEKKLQTDEELAALLAQTGITIDELKECFFRMQITAGYAKALPPDSPLRAKDKIIEQCQQLLVEAASQMTVMSLATYPVADLVFRHQSVVSAVNRSTDSAVEATPDVVPAAALTSGTPAALDRQVPRAGVGHRSAKLLRTVPEPGAARLSSNPEEGPDRSILGHL